MSEGELSERLIVETNFGPAAASSLAQIHSRVQAEWVEVFVTADARVCSQRMLNRLRAGGRHPGHNPGAASADDYFRGGPPAEPTGAVEHVIRIDTTSGGEVDLHPILQALPRVP